MLFRSECTTSFQLIANYKIFAFQFCNVVISRLAYHVFLMEINSGITPIFAPIGATGHLVYINSLPGPRASTLHTCMDAPQNQPQINFSSASAQTLVLIANNVIDATAYHDEIEMKTMQIVGCFMLLSESCG